MGALLQLPVDQRRAVVLASVHGRTALEISEIEGIPLGTAKTRLRTGLLKLRGELVPEVCAVTAVRGRSGVEPRGGARLARRQRASGGARSSRSAASSAAS